jgi:hypothetical protein
MATTTYLGTLQYDSGGGSYVDVGQIVDFTPHAMEVTDVKSSHLASPSAVHQYDPGFIEPGEIAFTLNFVKADYATLHGHLIARQKRNYKVRLNDGSTLTNGSNTIIQGYVKRLGKAQLSTDATVPIQATGTIKMDGLPAFTQGL